MGQSMMAVSGIDFQSKDREETINDDFNALNVGQYFE